VKILQTLQQVGEIAPDKGRLELPTKLLEHC
jgi:hypothetical protein